MELRFNRYDEIKPLADLKPSRFQRNKHPKQQIERLAKIMRETGVRHPIHISKLSGEVCFGHGRWEAAKLNGWTEFPVVYQDFKDETEEYICVQSDNAIAGWAELDMSTINADLGTMGPFDVELLGIKDFVVDMSEKDGLTDEDAVPEQRPTNIKMGDVYRLGKHRLMCGDSTKAEYVERLMNGEKAMLWSSDPPYGINYVKNQTSKWHNSKYDDIENDELQDEALREFIFNSIEASKPHMAHGFAFYMWHAMKMQAYFSQAAAAAGILFHRQIIWVKPNFAFGRGHYHWRHELCLMGWLKGNEPPFYGSKNQSTVWEIKKENDKIHPTQKPVELFEAPIANHTKPGEIVYEPFCGSGSGLIACEKTNRRCFGMEIDPHYCQVIVDRWEQYTGNKAELLEQHNLT